MGCKLRWEARRRMEFQEEQEHLPEEAIRKYEDLDEDEREALLVEEGRHFQIYNRGEATIDLSKARVTDSRMNSHVTLPTLKSVEEEAKINLRLGTYKRVANSFLVDSTDNGRQAPNLPFEVTKGLKLVSSRIKAGELVMLKTDKSDKFCPVSPEAFTMMGREHTSKDREITRKEAYQIHEHQDCHTSQMLKCFQMGASHGHQKRMRESYLGGKGIAPMNLLVKDHKPPDPKTGLPKTRPVVSGNRSNNGGPSEMVSLILEKVQRHNSASGKTASVISSEDFLHRLEKINWGHKASEEKLTMVATDVSALFPSMTATEAGRAARIKIEDSGLDFDGVDYEECLLYLKLNQHLT